LVMKIINQVQLHRNHNTIKYFQNKCGHYASMFRGMG
jgi:hypothetical protein